MSQTTDPISQPEPGTKMPDANGDAVYWRSLEQLQDPVGSKARLADEFQSGASEPPVLDDVSRRNFLGIAAASVAMATMTSCRKPVTRILPFARRPEDLVPGNPTYYATAHVHDGVGTGILVKSSDGRPTKVEGNPLHPSSSNPDLRPRPRAGGTDHRMQAELLNLYDPARAAHPIDNRPAAHTDEESDHGGHDPHADETQPTLLEFSHFLKAHTHATGRGLRILMEPTSSPSMAAAVARLRKKYPDARVHTWAPVNRDAALAATKGVYGRALDTQYDLTKADVIVSFDCDFQGGDGNSVRNARDYASRRTISRQGETDRLSRLYAVESFHSITGSNADHRFRVRASEIGDVVMALAAALSQRIKISGDFSAHRDASKWMYNGKPWVPILADDLLANRGKSALLVGPRLAKDVQVVLHAINHALGNVGKTVSYTETPVGLRDNCGRSIIDLIAAMDKDTTTLVILGGNPVYNAPANLGFAEKLAAVKTSIHLSQFVDETSQKCTWHVNQTHDLEAWGDVLSHDGTATLIQPLIAPLYDGISSLEMLELLTTGLKTEAGTKTETSPSGYDLVRAQWKPKAQGNLETWWARALHDGMVPGSRANHVTVSVNASAVAAAVLAHKPAAKGSKNNLEVAFRPAYNIHDGRYSNNSWLMELPDAMTKITWDNAALMSLATLGELDLEQGDVVEFSLDGRTVEAPVWVLPGHADHSITMTLGYGRSLGEDCAVAKGAGYNAYQLRSADAHDLATGLTHRKTGAWYKIAVTQEHGSMEGRELVREKSIAGYKEHPDFARLANPVAAGYKLENKEHEGHNHAIENEKDPERPPSLWDPSDLPEGFDYSKGYQWGMVIDLNTCTGCNACVAACVSENNIAMVGKEQITHGREMFWNRIDRYFGSNTESNPKPEGLTPTFNVIPDAENPMVVHQMVPCMQCENASCEVVCPVAATNHSPEGLNDMAYNRCIGTRYCGNNCPYKVRHFNYLDFHGKVAETIKMTRNPDVTIRSRGVMEKCTYCVQRINRAKIDAKKDGRRELRDGEIQTACEQSCPTQAITFGNINDKDAAGQPRSRVAKLKESNLNYGLLAELNMRPRTTYLAKIRNPNPQLA